MRFLAAILLSALLIPALSAQSEIKWTVNINTQQITQTEEAVFETLERELVNFLNSYTWTEDRFEEEERIEATLFLTLQEVSEQSPSGQSQIVPNAFRGTMAIQTVRPVYGTGEVTPVLNYQDQNLAFNYEQFQGVQFSEQSFTGELAAVLAFYSYLILGMDYDTFSQLGGQPFFEQAQELYNRLPTSVTDKAGWTTAGRPNNRFALLENLLSPRMLPMRRAAYNYHRLGLDQMVTDPLEARQNITLAIEDVQSANQTYPNSALVQAFIDAKREEIIAIYQGATPAEQNAVIQMMSRIDPSQSGTYRAIRSGGSTPSARRPVNRGQAGRR